MNDDDAIQYLSNLPDERLVAILQRVFAVKRPAPEEAVYCRNRFYLGTAWSDLESDEGEPQRWGPWELDAVAYVDPAESGAVALAPTTACANPVHAERAALAFALT